MEDGSAEQRTVGQQRKRQKSAGQRTVLSMAVNLGQQGRDFPHVKGNEVTLLSRPSHMLSNTSAWE